MSPFAGVPREAAELMSLAEREPIDEVLQPIDLERLSEARAGGGLAWGVVGHGVTSWRFRLLVRQSKLDLDFTRPVPNALSDESVQEREAAEIRKVCRLAALAVCRAEAGQLGRLSLRSDVERSWSWCLERDGAIRFGDTFGALVEALSEDGKDVDPLTVDWI